MLFKSVRLIPRYNWDFGISQWAISVMGAVSQNSGNSGFLENLFNRKPIFTSSGRASLYAILKGLKLPKGAGVAVPLFCCPVVFEAIEKAGYRPVFIDVNIDDFNISAIDLLRKKGTFSAVVAVHMFGRPADMDAVSAAAGDMPVIEDCAQSLFSKYKDKPTGALSKVSFFSFRSGKYISAGEGSAIFCEDENLRNSIQRIVNEFDDWSFVQMLIHSSSTYVKSMLYRRPLYGTIGYPIGKKLDQRFNLTAKTGFEPKKIARSNLKVINHRVASFHQQVEIQRLNWQYLRDRIKPEFIFLPPADGDNYCNCYQFALRFETEQQRNKIADFLFKFGIDTAKYLDEILSVVTEKYRYQGGCPTAEKCSKTILVIPNHYTLSRKVLDHIVSSINLSGKMI